MRRLLYVPIIHLEADLGSLAPAISARSAALCGPRRWKKHLETVRQYWQQVADYLEGLEARQVKIYQDGLPAGGELGRRVVTEGARRDSPNYRLILHLLEKGAELRKTEDYALLQQEYQRLARLASNPTLDREAQTDRDLGLGTEERDRYVALTIGETLKEGEIGLLFMGAYHRVLDYLPPDIAVERVKEPGKVRAYFQQLLKKGADTELERLARYLVLSPEPPKAGQKSRFPPL